MTGISNHNNDTVTTNRAINNNSQFNNKTEQQQQQQQQHYNSINNNNANHSGVVNSGGSKLANSAEIDKLKSQIIEEEQLKQALEQSYNELLTTSQELEKRMNLIDEESNEWKTRFENQEEINRQLTKQITLLENKLEELRDKVKNLKNRSWQHDDRAEKDPHHLINLEKEKQSLINQLRDYEWRLEQENKAYHKANEERKELHQEIIDTRNTINAIKEKQDLFNYQQSTISMIMNYTDSNNNNNNNKQQPSNSNSVASTSRRHTSNQSKNSSDYYYNNIPMDRRIIDPKKGPINKNAAVRTLPKLDTNANN